MSCGPRAPPRALLGHSGPMQSVWDLLGAFPIPTPLHKTWRVGWGAPPRPQTARRQPGWWVLGPWGRFWPPLGPPRPPGAKPYLTMFYVRAL